jgi:hypothetical protein
VNRPGGAPFQHSGLNRRYTQMQGHDEIERGHLRKCRLARDSEERVWPQHQFGGETVALHEAGGRPVQRLKARLNAASGSYSIFTAISGIESVPFRSMPAASCIRHRVRHVMGGIPREAANRSRQDRPGHACLPAPPFRLSLTVASIRLPSQPSFAFYPPSIWSSRSRASSSGLDGRSSHPRNPQSSRALSSPPLDGSGRNGRAGPAIT